jgi:hypothetical protein
MKMASRLADDAVAAELRKQPETSSERAERLRREKAAKIEAERDELEQHLASVDERLKLQKMAAEAKEIKRMVKVFQMAQREPPRRKMYDDKELAEKATIPGPGTYTPRLTNLNDGHAIFSGKTFGAAKYDPAIKYDKMKGTQDSYMEKMAPFQPGPGSYSPRSKNTGLGKIRAIPVETSFGLPPRLMEKYPHAEVPSAHDMGRMVAHLRDMPGPGAHTPREPRRSLGFWMGPPSRRTIVPIDGGPPGPGTYESPIGVLSDQASGPSATLCGLIPAMSQLEMAIVHGKTVPGPGRYDVPSTMRSKGSPRFSPGMADNSFIASVMNDAKTKPGPGAHSPTPTFADELAHVRNMRAAADEQRATFRA